MRRFTFDSPQGDMAALEFGNPAGRLAAVWLHAAGFNAMTYQSILAPLGLRTKVQALDLRGHGRTNLPAKAGKIFSWKTYRDDVIAFLDRQSPTQPVVLGGHSMGATIALLVAGRRPDKVAGLVLVDPIIHSTRFYRNAHLFPFLAKAGRPIPRRSRKRGVDFLSQQEIHEVLGEHETFKTWREPFLDDYILDAFDRVDDNDPDSEDQIWHPLCSSKWESASYGAQRHRPWSALAKVRKHNIPITLIRPQNESAMSDKIADRMARKCPQLVLKERNNTSHFLPMEAPYDVRDELSEYISRLIEGFSEGEDGAVKRSLR